MPPLLFYHQVPMKLVSKHALIVQLDDGQILHIRESLPPITMKTERYYNCNMIVASEHVGYILYDAYIRSFVFSAQYAWKIPKNTKKLIALLMTSATNFYYGPTSFAIYARSRLWVYHNGQFNGSPIIPEIYASHFSSDRKLDVMVHHGYATVHQRQNMLLIHDYKQHQIIKIEMPFNLTIISVALDAYSSMTVLVRDQITNDVYYGIYYHSTRGFSAWALCDKHDTYLHTSEGVKAIVLIDDKYVAESDTHYAFVSDIRDVYYRPNGMRYNIGYIDICAN